MLKHFKIVRLHANQIRIWIRSVHMCSCEASSAHEYSLTSRVLRLRGWPAWSWINNFTMQQIIHLETTQNPDPVLV